MAYSESQLSALQSRIPLFRKRNSPHLQNSHLPRFQVRMTEGADTNYSEWTSRYQLPTPLPSLLGCTNVQNGTQTWDKATKPNGCKRRKQRVRKEKEEIEEWLTQVKETKTNWKQVRRERIKRGPEGRKEQTSGKNRNTLKCVTRNNKLISITFARLYGPAQLFVAAYLGHQCENYRACILKFCICLWMRYLGNKTVLIPAGSSYKLTVMWCD